MNIRHTKRPKLIDVGGAQVTYRGTKSNTIVLCDEFRDVEWFPSSYPGGPFFVGAWRGTTIECNIPSWIRRAAIKAYLQLTK